MKALFKIPHNKSERFYNGNVIWCPPYVYPEKDLNNGIKLMEKKGYYVSLFPEGDGITFYHPNDIIEIDNKLIVKNAISDDNYLNDFKEVFYWMSFINVPVNEEFNWNEILDYPLVILPIYKLHYEGDRLYSSNTHFNPFKLDFESNRDWNFENIKYINTVSLGKFSIIPAGEFQIRKIPNIKKMNGEDFFNNPRKSSFRRDEIVEIANIKIENFESTALIVFTSDINFCFGGKSTRRIGLSFSFLSKIRAPKRIYIIDNK